MKRRVRRVLLALTVAGVAAAALAPVASAHYGNATITCTSVTFNYTQFFTPDAYNTVQQYITIDNGPATETDFTFYGFGGEPGDSDTVPINLSPGTHTVTADAYNPPNGEVVGFPVTETVTCTPVSASGAFTPGYWKNHEAATTPLLPQSLGGYTVSTFSQATPVFKAMNCGNSTSQNAFGCLAGHLLAAELNVANGATTPACAATAIAEANSLLTSGGYAGPTGTYTLTDAQRQSAIDLVGTLNSYNNNALTC